MCTSGNCRRREMSQQENPWATKHGFPLRSVLLIVLIVGLGAGATAYALGTTYGATNNTSNQNSQLNTNGLQWYGPGAGLRGTGLGDPTGSYTSFRAFSTVSNVTVTGFNIVDSTHFTLNLAYHGTGSTPALTIVGLSPGLSGSNTVSSGWTSPTTVSVSMAGTGSLSTTAFLRVLVVPLTGP